ncbi:hypothetical protein JJB09_04655 [Rhizobium sp. KVB221]|uniref:Uncharacterized protein n=1 Tax=Rhizobium setariae TaxID=2801340 RepID=A0A936YS06_9HYPH|nr:DUF6163 family protein [Rhizobium setariae]MBL0371310.1 hypothetical protein [Rhizobium setariae]
MTDLPMPPPKPFLPQILMAVFLRLVALGCLFYAVRLWGDLIGYSHEGVMRFDLLSTDRMAASAALAVLYPVAAIGLWLKGPWGPVMWSAAAVMEIVMHQVMPEVFGTDGIKIILIAATVVIYAVLRLSIIFLWPQKSASASG